MEFFDDNLYFSHNLLYTLLFSWTTHKSVGIPAHMTINLVPSDKDGGRHEVVRHVVELSGKLDVI